MYGLNFLNHIKSYYCHRIFTSYILYGYIILHSQFLSAPMTVFTCHQYGFRVRNLSLYRITTGLTAGPNQPSHAIRRIIKVRVTRLLRFTSCLSDTTTGLPRVTASPVRWAHSCRRPGYALPQIRHSLSWTRGRDRVRSGCPAGLPPCQRR